MLIKRRPEGGLFYAYLKEVMYLDINENLILECLNELNKNAKDKQKYKDYYEGNHSILKNYQIQDSRSNMKLVFNFPHKFIDNETISSWKPVIMFPNQMIMRL